MLPLDAAPRVSTIQPMDNETPPLGHWIIRAENHAERFGPDYVFQKYQDRERASRVAEKMASRVGVAMNVVFVDESGLETFERAFRPQK